MIHLTLKEGGGVVRINPAHIAAYHYDYRAKATTIHIFGGEGLVLVSETPEEIDDLLEDR